MKVDRSDRFVLTINSIEVSCEFYTRVLGMEAVRLGENRQALQFGPYKINLHQFGNKYEPKALNPLEGSADICFVTEMPMRLLLEPLHACNVEIVEGPMLRTGAIGTLESIYVRDPDGNLLEISNYKP